MSSTPSSAASRSDDADLKDALAHVDALERRVAELETTVEDLTDRIDEGADLGRFDGADHRDRAVLERLTSGETVTKGQLSRLYRTHTDIQTEDTVDSRVRSLTDRPEFDLVGFARWTFTVGGGDR